MAGYSDIVEELFSAQLHEWELARINYNLLSGVITRKIDFGKFSILLQFNPERIRSSNAKVDTRSIEARPCFLCSANRPAEQKGIAFGRDLTILVNPFPIFKFHLTIPSIRHTDQRIKGNSGSMLDLAKALPDFVIFYNGPQCGASAPDHFHFQAGNKGFLPIESDFNSGKFTEDISEDPDIAILLWKGYKRGIVTLKGSDPGKLEEVFSDFFNGFFTRQPDKPEPMLNILAYYENNEWIIHILPRILHRPTQFFKEGDAKILLSPASVDLGGVIITPREEDFNKITADDIADIFEQVCLNENEIAGFFIKHES